MLAIKEDFKRKQPILSLLVLIIYRFGNLVYYKIKIPIIRQILWIIYRVLDLIFNRAIIGIEIPAQCKIGAGFSLRHPNGIIIHQSAVIGSNATLYQQVTIGLKLSKKDKSNLAANIGNNVTISAGAKILGNISILDNSIIGANAVVTRDVPQNSIAVGIPAIIK